MKTANLVFNNAGTFNIPAAVFVAAVYTLLSNFEKDSWTLPELE
jgi:hypothetical protein